MHLNYSNSTILYIRQTTLNQLSNKWELCFYFGGQIYYPELRATQVQSELSSILLFESPRLLRFVKKHWIPFWKIEKIV